MRLILADTSVWIHHLREVDPFLVELAEGERLLMHPYVIGELSMGNLRNRAAFLLGLRRMEAVTVATHAEVSRFVETQGLFGAGIGWIDAHLLASVLLTPDADLWSRDQRLRTMAARYGRAAQLHN